MSTENKAHLTGPFRHEEETAGGAITPGHLIELNSAGKVVVHSTEGGYAERTFAAEDALQGNTLVTAYASADKVMINVESPGNDVQAFLFLGENVAIGDELISNGDGTLVANGSEASGVTVRQVVAIAREALDLTVSGAVTKLMKVRVL